MRVIDRPVAAVAWVRPSGTPLAPSAERRHRPQLLAARASAGAVKVSAMEGLAWFGTPTQPTAMDEAVDRATDELLIAPDWAIIMEICDEITQSSAAVDACRAIRRRMTHKNPKVALLALTLLEAGMKNCTEPFHAQVASKSFQADLVKVATGKGEAAERALSLVESFADAFQAQGYPQFGATYNSLVKKGVRPHARPSPAGPARARTRCSCRVSAPIRRPPLR